MTPGSRRLPRFRTASPRLTSSAGGKMQSASTGFSMKIIPSFTETRSCGMTASA
jgi:hypothetical protein